MRFFGHHGHSEREREQGGYFVVDLDIVCSVASAGQSDELSDTVNYVTVYHLVRALVEDQRFKLLEALSSRVAEAILALPKVESVTVLVTKDPRLPAQTKGFAVELTRHR